MYVIHPFHKFCDYTFHSIYLLNSFTFKNNKEKKHRFRKVSWQNKYTKRNFNIRSNKHFRATNICVYHFCFNAELCLINYTCGNWLFLSNFQIHSSLCLTENGEPEILHWNLLLFISNIISIIVVHNLTRVDTMNKFQVWIPLMWNVIKEGRWWIVYYSTVLEAALNRECRKFVYICKDKTQVITKSFHLHLNIEKEINIKVMVIFNLL